MIKEICKDHAILELVAEPATPADEAVATDLIDTMNAMGQDCACLAANQIGVAKAIIAYDNGNGIHVMYNPRIKRGMAPYTTAEACFSHDQESIVNRYQLVYVEYDVLVDGEFQTKSRKLSGYVAQFVQHAIDHCQGKLV